MTDSRPLFNVNEGLTGRDGGPYLDQVEAREAEIRRALVEKREPDLENPGPYAGMQLVTGKQLLLTANSTSIPSQAFNDVVGDALVKHAEDDDTILPGKAAEVPTDVDSEPVPNSVGDPNYADPFSEAWSEDFKPAEKSESNDQKIQDPPAEEKLGQSSGPSTSSKDYKPGESDSHTSDKTDPGADHEPVHSHTPSQETNRDSEPVTTPPAKKTTAKKTAAKKTNSQGSANTPSK